ncbi:MAG TPA: TolC family protein [Longimicrobium sp.]|jgi:outer membrane protein TolC|uniref:TolC family protein n=1 Tax=Longimicrobium sp. TaxID=2029185 RepID=UPI002ED7E85E
MKSLLTGAVLAALAPLALCAQADTVPLSLAEAQRVAAENNPQFRRTEADVATAEAEVLRARGAFLPSLSLGLRTGGSYSRRFTGVDQFGNTVVRDDPLDIKSSSAQQSLSLGQLTLFDGGARQKDARAARAGLQASQARVGTEGLRVRGEVERRYWDAVRASSLIRLEEELLRSARERLTATQSLLRVGVRGPLDVLAAEVTVAEQEQAVERARGDARRTELDLRQSMGVLTGPPVALTDRPADPFDPASLDAEALVARALASHPRLMRTDAAARQAEYRLDAARANRWPRLTAGASLGRSQFFSDYSGLKEPNPLDQAASFDLNLSYPIFSQYQNSARIQSARAGRDAALEDTRGERLAVERDVRAALVELRNAYAASALAARSLELNRRRLELARRQYQVGSLTSTELTDAVERAARAERDALRTRYEFASALATLRERTGETAAAP